MPYMDPNRINRIVIKVGSSTLTHGTGKLNLRRINMLARVLADLKNSGHQVVLVTSGAVAAGAGKLNMTRRPGDTAAKQAAAAVGQCALMHLYDKNLSEYGATVAQVLLTRDILDNATSRQNAANTFAWLLEHGVIPVVNENDSVSTYELEKLVGFGDNDRLGANVAVLCDADLLIILSDIDGFYDADPRESEEAKLIPVVSEITDGLRVLAGGAGALGTGGMAAKLAAAEIATAAGVNVVLANGEDPDIVLDICSGRARGTLFRAKEDEKA